MRSWLKRPSPATVIALVALVVASSGSAVAATLITSGKIKDGTIRLVDISSSAKKSLRGQTGKTGPRGATGAPGATGAAGRSALTPLRSGETIRGVWAMRGDATATSTQMTGVTFPIPAPVPVDSRHVVVQGQDLITGDGCIGTAATPVAAPGFVCIYFRDVAGTTQAQGYGGLVVVPNGANIATVGDGTPNGFIVQISGNADWRALGTWVYTAP